MMTKFRAVPAAIAMVAALGLGVPVQAADAPEPAETHEDTASVPAGGAARIYKHGVCRRVSNSNGVPIMVPLGTAGEWSGGAGSFLANLSDMDGVGVSTCFPQGVDLAFCYYTDTSGGYAPYWCGTGNESTLPVLRHTAGVFDSSAATLQAIKSASGTAANRIYNNLRNEGASRCVSNSSGAAIDNDFSGMNPLAAYDRIKDQIYWPAGVRWCLAYSWAYLTDHMAAGGDSGSGNDAAVSVMRVWNPALN